MPAKRKASKRKTKKMAEAVPVLPAPEDEACNVTNDGKLGYMSFLGDFWLNLSCCHFIMHCS